MIGLARNARLERAVVEAENALKAEFEATGLKARRCIELRYGARSWSQERRVVARLTDRVLREEVSARVLEVAERLISEEIERIKAGPR